MNNRLLQDPDIDLEEEEYLRGKSQNADDNKYLDASTIVWESIGNWQWRIIYGGIHRKELIKEAKKILGGSE